MLHSAILSTFIKLPFVIKSFVLSIFEWPFYTGFTVCDFEASAQAKTFVLIYIRIYGDKLASIVI